VNVRQIPSPEIAQRLAGGESLTIIDVRTPAEYVEGHVPGSHHIPLDELPASLEQLPRDRTLYLMCHSGSRSDYAGKWLAQQGFDVVNIAGGMLYWTGPVTTGDA
jgi:queuine tRNA-ribosyltransferase